LDEFLPVVVVAVGVILLVYLGLRSRQSILSNMPSNNAKPAPAKPHLIAGVDEVGRGPLAGAVVAAAVILNPKKPIEGLLDSKLLDESTREVLDKKIRAKAMAYCIAEASVSEIDQLNILHASMLAMQRAIVGLGMAPNLVSAP